METYENQKVIEIKKEPADKAHLYTVNNLDALQSAMVNLNYSEFKVWMFFAKNQAGYEFASGPSSAKAWGITRDTYQKGIRKLIELGYLVPKSEGSNKYWFYEKPREEEIIVEKVSAESGFIF